MASLTGSAISVSAPVMRRSKATNGIPSLNSVSFFGQKRSFPSSLRLSISCHARRDDIFDEVRKIVREQLDADESKIVGDASFIDDLRADSLDIFTASAVGLPQDSYQHGSRDNPMADAVNCTTQYSSGYEFGLVELVMALEERFDIEIDEESAQSISTVGQAVDMIEEKTSKYRW